MSLKIDVSVQTNDERVEVNMLPDVDLETHLDDKNNPHKVTPEQIGIAGCEAVSLPQLLDDGKITSDCDGTISVTENSIEIAPKEFPHFGGIKIDIALLGFFDIEFRAMLASATVYVDDVFVGYVSDNGLSFCGNIEKSLTVEVGAISGYWVGINRFDKVKGGTITPDDYYAFKNNGGGGDVDLSAIEKRIDNIEVFATPQMYGAKGDGKTDDTQAFIKAIAENPFVYVPDGTYMIQCEQHTDDKTLFGIPVPSNREIVMGNNAVLKQIASSKDWTFMFHLKDVSNVRITGGKLVGDRAERTSFAGLHGHGHGIKTDTCRDVFISNITITDFMGDGISLSVAPDEINPDIWNENIYIDNVVVDNCWRNGVNIGQAKRVYINDSVFSNTKGWLPECGIDIECNVPNSLVNEYIYISNCRFHGNATQDICLVKQCDNVIISDCVCETRLTSARDSFAENIQIIDCDINIADAHGETFRGCRIRSLNAYSVGGHIENCIVDYMEGSQTDGSTFTFEKCTISSVAMNGTCNGKMLFNDCKFHVKSGSRMNLYGELFKLTNCNVFFDNTYTSGVTPINAKDLIAIDTAFCVEASLNTVALILPTTVKLIGCVFDVPSTIKDIVNERAATTIAIGCKFLNHKRVGNVSGENNIIHDNIFMGVETKIPTKVSEFENDLGYVTSDDVDPKGTATSAVSTHNTSEDSHNDIRLLIEGLSTRLNAIADSDDTTLDQMSEIVAYIKSNKSLIESITTSKVNVSDIIDNLTTNVSNKPLSAKQGVELKKLIDDIINGGVESIKTAVEGANTAATNANNAASRTDMAIFNANLATTNATSAKEAIETARDNGEFNGKDGTDGTRGTGILNITGGLASHSATVNGSTSAYRILLSRVKTDSKVNDVLVGDTIRYSTFLYPIIHVDSEYAYCSARTSIQGSAGTSITVKSVSESTESGGSNVVTFSDNKTVTIKNGKDGDKGDPYTLTDTDKNAIVQAVINSLTNASGVSF